MQLNKKDLKFSDLRCISYRKIISKKIMDNYCTKKRILGVHPDIGNPGINASTGSLGHGLAFSVGIALAEKDKSSFFYFFYKN
jgi:transketolase N-terminal domain/subunit